MRSVSLGDIRVVLPQPILPVIEDVGWWRGEDGSAVGEPYRNAFPRAHCLEDYQALIRFAGKLGTRLPLGMVFGEWDQTNLLAAVPGSTWQGTAWNNSRNCGPHMAQTVELINDHPEKLEVGLHGLCHEFWLKDGSMERSEFHDGKGRMRARETAIAHLEACYEILKQHGFHQMPRIFFPPALNHSFGNAQESMQAILYGFGIRHVVTRFERANQFQPPRHKLLTWECGVGLLERGMSPVAWSEFGCLPEWNFSGPILPLHWGNLLHADASRNSEIVDGWVDMLLARTTDGKRVIARDYEACWRQVAVHTFAKLASEEGSVVIDLQDVPEEMPERAGSFTVTLNNELNCGWCVSGANVVSQSDGSEFCTVLELLPDEDGSQIRLIPG